tara:strand:+ start:541 stop:669 length:129 start_codon:yes stop_codon:yes gene_type:complete
MTQIKSDPRVHNRAKPVQEKPKEVKVAAKEAAPKRKAAKSKE